VENVDQLWQLGYAIPRSLGWPDDAYAEMDPNYPKDVALTDCLSGSTLLVASGRTRELLPHQPSDNVEFLPVTIVNHKGRVASRDYYVVHPLTVVECIDAPASGAVFSAIDPETIVCCDALVLNHDEIPPELELFRPKYWPDIVLIRQTLADRLVAAGLTGLNFWPLDEYTGLV